MIPELALDPAPARRPRDASAMRRVLVPVAVAAGGLAVLGTTRLLFDPFTRDVPLCPVHAMTGLLCPGRGMTRAVHALTAGDPVLAVRSNALVLLLVPAAVLGWARWFRARLRGCPPRHGDPGPAVARAWSCSPFSSWPTPWPATSRPWPSWPP